MNASHAKPNADRADSRASKGADEQIRLVGSDRVLAVLKELALHPDGVALDELTRAVASPKPTVHRALRSLRRAGFTAQDAGGRYILGDEFLRLAFAHHEARPDHIRVMPVLKTLAARFGETVHYAVLEGRSVVYRSKVDPPTGGVRLTSTIGGRNPAHATGVGKMLMAYHIPTLDDLLDWIGDDELERRTANTKVAPEQLYEDLKTIRERGYSLDEQENELGVHCLALPVFLTSPTVPSGAVSISALAYRTPLDALIGALPEIRSTMAAVT